MESVMEVLSDFKGFWASLSVIVGIIIWVYRLREDASQNSKKIKVVDNKIEEIKLEKKECSVEVNEKFKTIDNRFEKMDSKIKHEISNTKEYLEDKVELMNLKLNENIRSVEMNIKNEFKEHTVAETKRAERMFGKLDNIQNELVEVKIIQAKQQVKNEGK